MWLAILIIASANIWLGEWTGALVIVAQLAILFRARYTQHVAIEVFAAVLIWVPLYYVYQGVLVADSYRFMLLPLFAKLALISAFAQLWLWSAFYRKYQPNSSIKQLSESVRIVFYMLLPVCWVASVIRRFDEDAVMLLWLSPLIALGLARKINHHILQKEAQLLSILASIAIVVSISQLSFFNSTIALLGFAAFYAVGYWLNNQSPAPTYRLICSCAFIGFGFVIPQFIGIQSHSLFWGCLSAAIYWAVAFNLVSQSLHLKRNEVLLTIINLLLVLAAWLYTLLEPIYACIPLLFLTAAVYQQKSRFKFSKLSRKLNYFDDLLLHSIGAITYVTLFYGIDFYRLELLIAPALAVHGALILFLKDKRITTVKYSFALILIGIIKLAIIDAANAQLWQKVILFMGIGVFILMASFWYQKLVNKEPTAEINNA